MDFQNLKTHKKLINRGITFCEKILFTRIFIAHPGAQSKQKIILLWPYETYDCRKCEKTFISQLYLDTMGIFKKV